MKSCIYIGMASDDVDISELVETIAVTAREIEENSRVCKTNPRLIPFLGSLEAASGGPKGSRSPQKYLFVPEKCVKASSELSLAPGTQKPMGTGHSPCPGWAHSWEAENRKARRGSRCRGGEAGGRSWGRRAFGRQSHPCLTG